MAVHEQAVIQYLTIGQGITHNQKYESISQLLSFHEGDDDFVLHDYVDQELIFTEIVEYSFGIANRHITQTLSFSQIAQRIKEGWVYQNLLMTQSTVDGAKQWKFPAQVLSLSDSVSFTFPKAAFDTLAFSETVKLNYRLPKSVTDTLVFTQGVVVYSETERFIAIATPAVSKQITLTLTAPHVGTLTLPAPDFSNTESIGQTRIQRQSRGGDYIIWRDSQWPITQEFDMVFSYLSNSQVANLQAFVAKTCGKIVALRDHNNQTFNVVITSPEVEISTPNYPQATIKFLVIRNEDA